MFAFAKPKLVKIVHVPNNFKGMFVVEFVKVNTRVVVLNEATIGTLLLWKLVLRTLRNAVPAYGPPAANVNVKGVLSAYLYVKVLFVPATTLIVAAIGPDVIEHPYIGEDDIVPVSKPNTLLIVVVGSIFKKYEVLWVNVHMFVKSGHVAVIFLYDAVAQVWNCTFNATMNWEIV